MIHASQLRAGMAVRHEGQMYKVLAADYHPGQGKMGGVAHVRLKNLSSGTLWEHSFRADLKLEDLAVEKQAMDFLYSDDEQCYFMNPESYEQVGVAVSVIGPQAAFLVASMRVPVEFVEGQPVNVLFPDVIEMRVADTAPPVHQQQDNTWKPAKLNNGVEIMVPQFIKAGDVVRLDSHNLKYMERAKPPGR
jgi:elongation factor P